MKRLVVVRPLPGALRTVEAASAQGLVAVAMPVQEYEPVEWHMPQGDFDGLLVGSAMAFAFPSAMLDETRHLPVHAVGATTAAAAESSGYRVASTGVGGLQAVIDALPADKHHRLLRIGGEERVPLDLPEHVNVVEAAAYRLVDIELTAEEAGVLGKDAVVALHSAGAARSFRRNCERLDISLPSISLACLGPRIASAAGEGWACVESADSPNDAALLALARTMCQ